MIWITLLLQLLIGIIITIEYQKIRNIPQDSLLYGHGVKSLQDTYKVMIKLIFMNEAVIILLALLFNLLYFIFSFFVMLIWLPMYISFSLYMITEVKHLSPNDGVNKKIRNEDIIDAKQFYAKEFFLGLLLTILMILQAFLFSYIIGAVSIVICIFLYVFGMADVLQYSNYNSPNFKDDYKQKDFWDKLFIRNIINFFVKKDYHQQSMNALIDNTKNIKLGMIHIFK